MTTTIEVGKRYTVRHWDSYCGLVETTGTVIKINPDEPSTISDRQGGYYRSKGQVYFTYEEDGSRYQSWAALEEAQDEWTAL